MCVCVCVWGGGGGGYVHVHAYVCVILCALMNTLTCHNEAECGYYSVSVYTYGRIQY